MSSTFNAAGVSQCNNKHRVRFGKDITRIKVLVRCCHKDIEMVELPRPMTKSEICTHLKTLPLFMDKPEFRAAVEAADDKYNPVAVVKKTKARKVSTKTKEETIAELTARAAEVMQTA